MFEGYLMKPIGQRSRPRILTNFGRLAVVAAVVLALCVATSMYRLLK